MADLVGLRLPDVTLPATSGGFVNPGAVEGQVVFFVYPYTGRPGVADPKGWDRIAGAHGSTPQALGFSRLYAEFAKLHTKVFGVSFQDTAWQQEFVTRNSLAFPLLSDAARGLANALRLETFRAGEGDYLRRRTLVAVDGVVTQDFTHFTNPGDDANRVLKDLQA